MAFKKFLASIMIMSTVAGVLTGCTGGVKKEAKETTATAVAAKSEAPSNLNKEGLPILKEPEEFVVVVEQISTTHKVEDKPIVKELEAATNVKIKWIEIPTSSWKEKINIMFASGDLPDAFMSNVDTALYYEQLLELNGLIEEYGPNVQKILEDPRYAKGLKAPDGKIHQLPGGDEGFNNQIDKTLWINQTWLKKLGLEQPTTTDEFYAVLKAFKEKDPNGNGQQDEIPLTFKGIGQWATGMGDLFGPFGVVDTEKHVYMDGDKVVLGAQEKGYYEALQWFHKLFKEGLIDQEAFSHSQEQYNSKAKGKDIIGSTVNWRAEVTVGAELKDNYTHVVPLKGPEGKQTATLNELIQTEGFAISTTCKNPAALLRWYDYVNSSQEMALKVGRGVEGEFWKKVEGGYMFTPENCPEGMSAGEWRPNFSFSGQTPALWTLAMDTGMIPGPNDPPNVKKFAIEASLPFTVKTLPAGSDKPENSERRTMILTDLRTYLEKFVADSVINGIDEKKWEEHLKALKDLHADEYVALSQEYVDRMSK